MSKSNKGMQIYLDSVERKIVSAEDEPNNSEHWYPSNVVARRLWACLEILRDINDLLEDGQHAKNSGKRKKKVKFIAGQVHSFAKAIDALCKSITGGREIRKALEEDKWKQVEEIRKDFSEFVPFDFNTDLSKVRNKLVAHFDEKFWPSEANKLLNAVPTHKIGRWLHICLHALLDLSKLDIYAWTCPSGIDGYARFMTNEPFILTIGINEETQKIESLAGIDIAHESPKNTVQEVIVVAIEYSQWMFKKGQSRIGNLFEDHSGDWNTFRKTRDFYARGA